VQAWVAASRGGRRRRGPNRVREGVTGKE
jgi:hypothetical protein